MGQKILLLITAFLITLAMLGILNQIRSSVNENEELTNELREKIENSINSELIEFEVLSSETTSLNGNIEKLDESIDSLDESSLEFEKALRQFLKKHKIPCIAICGGFLEIYK